MFNWGKKDPQFQRWEYKIIPIGSYDADDFADNSLLLDTMGQIGWEMVAIYGQYVIFKRHAQA